MGGESGRQAIGDLVGFAAGFSASAAERSIQREAEKKQKQADLNVEVATGLAERGLFRDASPDLIKSIEKTAGKDALPALFQLDQSASALRQFRQGALDITERPVREQVGERDRPLFANERLPPGVVDEGLPELQGEEAAPPVREQVPIFNFRGPSDIERFNRFRNEIGPVGVSLIGGNDLGQLALGELRAKVASSKGTKSQKDLKQGLIIKLAELKRRTFGSVAADEFDEADLPEGTFPVPIGDEVLIVQGAQTTLRYRERFQEYARALGFETLEDIDEKASLAIITKLHEIDLGIAEVRGQNAAKVAREVWLDNELDRNYPGGHNYVDRRTGELFSGSMTQREVIALQKQGHAGKLTTQERQNLIDIKNVVDIWNQAARQLKLVYGPGGIFENLTPEGRIFAAATGGFARLFQTDTNLSILAKSLEGNLTTLGRGYGQQKGHETEPDTQRMRQLVATVTGFPDTKGVAIGTMNNMRELVIRRMERIIGAKKGTFTQHGLDEFDDVPAEAGLLPGEAPPDPTRVNFIETRDEANQIIDLVAPNLPRKQRKALVEVIEGEPTTRQSLVKSIRHFMNTANPGSFIEMQERINNR